MRVNAISAGPIRTLAASGVSGIRKSIAYVGEVAPMGNVTQDNIGDAARFLLSDWASGVTGEVLYVDGGYNIMGAPDPARWTRHPWSATEPVNPKHVERKATWQLHTNASEDTGCWSAISASAP